MKRTPDDSTITVRAKGGPVIAVASVILGGVLVASTLWSWDGRESLGLLGWFLFAMGMTVVLLYRPCIELRADGILLANPFRRTLVPWGEVTGVGTRWTLSIQTATSAYASWAISTAPERPTQSVFTGWKASDARVDTMSVADMIELDMAARRVVKGARVRQWWDPWDVSMTVGPLLLVAASVVG